MSPGLKLGADARLPVLAPVSITVAQLQQIEAEFEVVNRRLRDLSALRLQTWFRKSRWLRSTLPRQLLRVRLLVHSCIVIQSCWRAASARWGQSSLAFSTSFSPKMSCSFESESLCMAFVISTPRSVPLDKVENDADTAQSYDHAISSSTGDGFEPMSLDRRPAWGLLHVHLGCSLGLAGARAAALWRGYYVRRAISCRSLQMKIKLRHDLYLLISDVERRQKWQGSGQPPQRLGPWVDVLYTGLGRLQHEVLEGFEAVLFGRTPLWGGARLPVVWLGWPCDLSRLPRLAVKARELSVDGSEPSLIAATMLQTCSPPRSPVLDDGGRFRADAVRIGHQDSMCQDPCQVTAGATAGSDVAAACLPQRRISGPSAGSVSVCLSPSSSCGPREVFAIPSDYEVLAPAPELPVFAAEGPSAAPSKASSLPASPAHRSRDWSKVRPRIDARLVRAAPVGPAAALQRQDASNSRGGVKRSAAAAVRRPRAMSSSALAKASSMPLFERLQSVIASSVGKSDTPISRTRPGVFADEPQSARKELVCLDEFRDSESLPSLTTDADGA